MKRKMKGRRRLKDNLFYAALVGLPLLQFVIFYIGINASSFALAFQTYKDGKLVFAGLDNFIRVFEVTFKDGAWGYAFRNSILIFLLGFFINTPLTLIISYFIYKKKAIGGWMKVILYAPSILSTIVHTTVFMYTVNQFLPGLWQSWFGETIPSYLNVGLPFEQQFTAIYLFTLWGGFGTSMLLYTNAMDSIPISIVEAAKIDGVGFFREFISITFPMIFDTWKTLFIVGLAGIFTNQFFLVEFYGMAADSYMSTVGYILYKDTIVAGNQEYTQLAALGLVLSAITIVVTLFFRWLTNKLDPMERV